MSSRRGFTPTADLHAIRDMVRAWIRLVSRRDFVAAASYLTPVPDAKVVRSPDAIRDAFGRYDKAYREADPAARDAFFPKVSDPTLMATSGESLVIYLKTRVGVAFLEYACPSTASGATSVGFPPPCRMRRPSVLQPALSVKCRR